MFEAFILLNARVDIAKLKICDMRELDITYR